MQGLPEIPPLWAEATIGEEKDQQLVVVGDFREVPTKPATALCLTEGEAPYKDVSYWNGIWSNSVLTLGPFLKEADDFWQLFWLKYWFFKTSILTECIIEYFENT